MSPKLKLISFIVFFFTIVFSFGLPVKKPLVERSGLGQLKCKIGDNEVDNLSDELITREPNVILLGNSMLGNAVDQRVFENAVEQKTMVVWSGGSSSAWWYLVVKNVIIPSPAKPKYVAVFFRDNYLTLPQYRIGGNYKSIIDIYATENEKVLDRVLYFNEANPISLWVQSYIPFIRSIDLLKNKLRGFLKKLVSFSIGLGDSDELERAIAFSFNEDKYNDKLFHLAQVKEETDLDNKNNYSFHPERTFLPHIIKLCKENDVELIFVRVKRKRDVFDNKQPVELMSYQEKLRIYLEEKEVSFIDYSKNSSIRSEHFDKGDHLSLESGMPLFTRIFSENFKSLF